MQKLKLTALGLLLAAAGVFVAQNTITVEARFLGYSVRAPQALMLFTAMALGFVLGLLSIMVSRSGGADKRP